MTIEEMYKNMEEIFSRYPRDEWYDRCIEAISDIDKDMLISMIELERAVMCEW